MAKGRLKDMMSLTNDANQKKNMNISIDEINNRSARTKADISKLKVDIEKRRKDIELKTKEVLKGIQDDIKNITKSQKQKKYGFLDFIYKIQNKN